jgi:mono/diheme cytochrome c family protein
MKNVLNGLFISLLFLVFACGSDANTTTSKATTPKKAKTSKKKSNKPASQTIDLENKGIGPISSVSLGAEVDTEMAKKGEKLFTTKCTACHKLDKRFIGPSPKGLLDRRTPEWIMNMILNPDEMVKKDPLAKELLKEFNGSPMANQSLTEEEARSILEYFRTLK